jgi:hypothetical protein
MKNVEIKATEYGDPIFGFLINSCDFMPSSARDDNSN